jgi:hypothetical protein
LKEHIASFLRVEEYAKQEISVKQVASRRHAAPKHKLTFNGPHGVISQEIEVFIGDMIRVTVSGIIRRN